MTTSNKITRILKELAPWVQELKFNPITMQWFLQFKQGQIFQAFNLEDVIFRLEKHVVAEVVALVAEALDLNPAQILKKNSTRPLADGRIVSAIIIKKRFPGLSQKSISTALGWKTHFGVVYADKYKGIKEIDDKIANVYKTYRFLERGNIEIKNFN